MFNGDKPVELDFNVTDTLLVNFSRCIRNKEYIFTFVNDNNYESLTFTFHSNLEIDCYFEFTKADGKPMDSLYGWQPLGNDGDTYFYTEGQAAKPFMYETALELRNKVEVIAKEVFST
jgi:hypothetical protein